MDGFPCTWAVWHVSGVLEVVIRHERRLLKLDYGLRLKYVMVMIKTITLLAHVTWLLCGTDRTRFDLNIFTASSACCCDVDKRRAELHIT